MQYVYWLNYENAYQVPILSGELPIEIDYDRASIENLAPPDDTGLQRTLKYLESIIQVANAKYVS